MQCIKIGLIRETKTPPDKRVALPPKLAATLVQNFPEVNVVAQPGGIRCFTDQEYLDAGIPLQEDLSDCDLLVGIKEVKIEYLIPGKHYLFFAHVAKRQKYNKPLLRALLDKKITLSDYEYFTDRFGIRMIAFGRWAGIIGAYNGLRAWFGRQGNKTLKPANQCYDRREMDGQLIGMDLGKVRILVTGGGRVAQGAMETLCKLGIPVVTAEEYLSQPELSPVICRVDPVHYAERIDRGEFTFARYCSHPEEFRSKFSDFYSVTDLLIAAHYWDPRAPRLWEPDEMKKAAFRIRAIADISCDINGSVPSTVRPSTISDPFYDWNPLLWKEEAPFAAESNVTVMAIDNLPGELPRDASEEFGKILLQSIMPCILGKDVDGVMERATITSDGKLTDRFAYLEEFLSEPD